jgi:hypothetical protein
LQICALPGMRGERVCAGVLEPIFYALSLGLDHFWREYGSVFVQTDE